MWNGQLQHCIPNWISHLGVQLKSRQKESRLPPRGQLWRRVTPAESARCGLSRVRMPAPQRAVLKGHYFYNVLKINTKASSLAARHPAARPLSLLDIQVSCSYQVPGQSLRGTGMEKKTGIRFQLSTDTEASMKPGCFLHKAQGPPSGSTSLECICNTLHAGGSHHGCQGQSWDQ